MGLHALCLLWGYACFGEEEERDGCARTRGVGAGPGMRRWAHAQAAARLRPLYLDATRLGTSPAEWGIKKTHFISTLARSAPTCCMSLARCRTDCLYLVTRRSYTETAPQQS